MVKALPSDDDDNSYLYGLVRKKDECKRCEDEIASLHLSPLAGLDSLLERNPTTDPLMDLLSF